MTKFQFLHSDDNDDDTKAITIPLVFSENSRANKLKEFADNKFNFGQISGLVFHRVENTVGKGENAGYQPS